MNQLLTILHYLIVLSDLGLKIREIFSHYDSIWLRKDFCVIVRDPIDVQTVLNAEETFKLSSSVDLVTKFELLTGDGGEKYKAHRKNVYPIMHETAILKKLSIMNEEMDTFLKSFGIRLNGKSVDAYQVGIQIGYRGLLRVLYDSENSISDQDLELLLQRSEE